MIQSTFLMMTYWTILEITIILEFPLIFLVPDMTINYLSLNKAFSQMIYLKKRKLIMTIMVLLKFLDTIFQPLDGMDENIYTNIWLDYGKIEGTPDSVQYHVMPWLYEDNSEEDENELETENENSKKVIDTGFRPDQHAFLFGNMKTT